MWSGSASERCPKGFKMNTNYAFSGLARRIPGDKRKVPLRAPRKLLAGFLVSTTIGLSFLAAQEFDVDKEPRLSGRSSLARPGTGPSLWRQGKRASVGGPWAGMSISTPLRAERVDSYSPFGSRLSAGIGDAGVRWGPHFGTMPSGASGGMAMRLPGTPSSKAPSLTQGQSTTRWLPFPGPSPSLSRYHSSKSKGS
jgi:hypothetical protein